MDRAAEQTKPTDLIGREAWALGANILTVGRFVGAPIMGLLVWIQNPWWLTFWLGWALGISDYVDGWMARRASPTRLGAFLDPLADKAVVVVVLYVLVAIGRFHWLPVTIIAGREVVMTIYRSYWARRGLAIPARKSAKYKTLVQGLAIAAALCPPLGTVPWVGDGLLWLAAAFSVFTAYQYALDGRGALRLDGRR